MTTRRKLALEVLGVLLAAALAMPNLCTSDGMVKGPLDPGVRGGAAGAGGPLNNLTADESAFFQDGVARFAEVEVVTGGSNNGLGPRFNSNQCLSCHSQPAPGGTSPAQNPLIQVATLSGAKNVVPWFIAQNGPVREARFKRNPNGTNDGGVHNLFVITGRSDAAGCDIAQPNFLPAGNRSLARGGVRTSSSASRHLSLALGLSKRSPTRRSSRTCRPMPRGRRRWASPVTPTRT